MTREVEISKEDYLFLTEREKETMALDSDTSAEMLLKLAFDSSEKVRALVGINRNTSKEILMELKKDSSELVQRTATYSLNHRDSRNNRNN